jgi:hypothetical protein
MDGLHGIIFMDHFIGNFVSDVVLGTILTDRRTVCIRASIIHFGDFATIGTGEIITGAGLTDGRTVTILVAGILFDRIPTIVTGDVGFPTIVTNIFTGTVGVGESNVITERFATIGTSDFVFHRSLPLALVGVGLNLLKYITRIGRVKLFFVFFLVGVGLNLLNYITRIGRVKWILKFFLLGWGWACEGLRARAGLGVGFIVRGLPGASWGLWRGVGLGSTGAAALAGVGL